MGPGKNRQPLPKLTLETIANNAPDTWYMDCNLPPPGRTISLVGNQLPALTLIHHTKKRHCPLLHSTRTHALPSVRTAALIMNRQTWRTRPAHKDHEKLPHRPKVTLHRLRAQQAAICQPSPTAHHKRNQPIPLCTKREGVPSNHTRPHHPDLLTA